MTSVRKFSRVCTGSSAAGSGSDVPALVLLGGLFDGRTPGPDVWPALPGRDRWHHAGTPANNNPTLRLAHVSVDRGARRWNAGANTTCPKVHLRRQRQQTRN